MVGITTLEEYFSWLKVLSKFDKKFTRLPIDEECFEINANTRAINIPASFKKNGVAIQGDDLAEIVYFKIDRYFDYMDLANTVIFIQWETPRDASGNIIKSVSPAYIKDIESEPGKLIFGWALSDAITGTAGTLKFSVRFFQWKNDETEGEENASKEIVYSFSTLTASVTIHPSINFNPETDEYKLDDVGERLIERIKESQIVGGYGADTPIFIVDLLEEEYDLDPISEEFELQVKAQTSDTGAISYIWKYQGLNEDNTPNENDKKELESANSYEIIDMTNLEAIPKSRTYYYMSSTDEEGNPTRPVLYTGAIPPTTDWVTKHGALYEKLSAVKAKEAGIYQAEAKNRMTNSMSTGYSIKAVFPRPKFVKITQQPIARGVLQASNGVETPQTLSVFADNTDGVLTYQWEKDPNYGPLFNGEASAFEVIEGATEATYIAKEPGHYRVKVTNTRNKADIYEFSNITRITNFPASPIVTYPDLKRFTKVNLADGVMPTVSIDPSVESDEYTVAWYMAKFEENVEDKEIVKDLKVDYNDDGTITAKFNPLDYLEKLLELEEDVEGFYYCIVTNKVNGEVKLSEKVEDDMMFVVAG